VKQRQTAVAGEAAHLAGLTAFLQEFWWSAHLPPTQALPFELALEEVFMNDVMLGSAAAAAPWVEMTLFLRENGVTITA
jgi:hypothetical protein